MAASKTVPQLPGVSQLPRHGTLCLFGFGIRVSVVNGNLLCHDGIGRQRRTILLSKINSNLKRLVLVGSDGFLTLQALRWIGDRDASFYILDRRGKVLVVCGPPAPSDCKIRRAQSLALINGTALRISKELIRRKLEGQAMLAREMLHNSRTAEAIENFRDELAHAESIDALRHIESRAGRAYWSAWSGLPIRWIRKDETHVPSHWKCFSSRISALTHSPRLATEPINACLNFLYSISEAEARLSAVVMGCDPGLGLMHRDAPHRDSLACDLQEPVRASIDAFVLNWFQNEPLRKSDFWEDRNGNCRICTPLAVKLCETAETWRRLVAPVAEYVAEELADSIPKGPPSFVARVPTRLTQRRRTEGRGKEFRFRVKPAPQPSNICSSCGAETKRGRHCPKCGKEISREKLIELAKQGRVAALSSGSQAKRSETQRRHEAAKRKWHSGPLADWPNDKAYNEQIQPWLMQVPISTVASTLGVCESYAADIRAGRRRPHSRHWRTLAQLAGVAVPPDVAHPMK